MNFDKTEGSYIAAKTLLEIEAMQFDPDRPIRFASGRLSPMYVDVRRLIGVEATLRKQIITGCCDLLFPYILKFDCAAGGETAGIPFAAWIADRLGLRMVYVRKAPKGHGRMAQIEGLSEAELAVQNYLLIEDLMSEGGSKQNFINAINATEGMVTVSFVIFSYGCFGAEEMLRKQAITPLSLVDARLLVAVARDLDLYRYNSTILPAMERFIDDPDAYWKEHDAEGYEKATAAS